MASISTSRHGERRAILGPNGAGKTTLFNVDLRRPPGIDRHRRAASGRTSTTEAGPCRAPRRASPARTSSPASVHGSDGRGQHLPVDPGRQGRTPAARDPPKTGRGAPERAGAAAARVAISHKLDQLVGSLSHGEQRQVALAMALASEPKILMLDEPASGFPEASERS